jgi:Uma2 family endonuclease
MNEISKSMFSRTPSQAAEGLPRWRWTLAEFDQMIEVGLLGEDDRVELIDGEMVPMHSKGGRHEAVKTKLLNHFVRRMGAEHEISIELGWRPGGDMYLEPDIVLYNEGPSPSYVPAADALLVVEVSDSSLRYDRDRKAKLYAALGVREYWVVDATTLQTIVHLEPGTEGYGKVSTHAPSETVAPLALPALTVSLGALKIG